MMDIIKEEDVKAARGFIKHGTGTYEARRQIVNRLALWLSTNPHQSGEKIGEVLSLIDEIKNDTDIFLGRPLEHVLPTRAEPTNKGRRNSREHFESLIMEITGCVVGDGTLAVKEDASRSYKNEYIQYMWMRYRHQAQ